MSKIAVVTDSNSGIRQNQAEALRVHVLPMPFTVNGASFFEDINLTTEVFFEKLIAGAEISTSQPAIGDVMDLWDKLLTTHDEIVHIPMSSGLSAAYGTALSLAEEYDGRVQVVNNQRISVTLRQSVLDAVMLAEAGWDAKQIRTKLEAVKFDSSIYIMVDTLKYLKKGGRITAAGAAIGSLLNIKPVLQIQGEKLDSYAKTRGVKQARTIMIEAIRNDFNKRFAPNTDPARMWLQVAYTYNQTLAEDFRQEVSEVFPGFDIHMDPLSLSVSCHIGPGALAVACSVKVDSQ